LKRTNCTARRRTSDALKSLYAVMLVAVSMVLNVSVLANWPVLAAPVLKGSVELSAERSVLDPRLAPGNKFNSKLFGQALKEERWEQIPDWLAGTWKQETRTRTHNKDEASGAVDNKAVTFQSMRIIKKGFQRKNGKTWDYFATCIIEQVASNHYTTYSYLIENDPVSVTPTKMVAFRCTINVCVDKNQQIKDTYQTEEIESFINEKPGVARNELQMRTFDMNGKPRSTLELWSPLSRVAPYADTVKYEGMDMQASLSRYLAMKAKSAQKPTK
jgi:hypothetical protein